jgi:long-chain acyl-CoA synthetase
MKRIWLDSYPPGVPREIDARAFPSLAHLFRSSFERFAPLPAFESFGSALSYAEVDRLSAAFGAYLRGALGLSRGDRVAIVLPNLLQYPVALIGALRSGLIVVNANPLYTADELRHQLTDSGAVAVVVLENFARTLEDALPGTSVRHVIVTQAGDLLPAAKRHWINFAVRHLKRAVPRWRISGAVGFREALARASGPGPQEPLPGPEDVALLQYTGGTTGRPRGAILTHGNLVANVEQTLAWFGAALEPGRETILTALPLYHVFALTANLLVFLRLGGRNVLVADPRDLGGLLALLARTRCTAITGVNTLYKALLDDARFETVRGSSAGVLKLAIAGGMALDRSVAQRWQRAVGLALIEGYGLTEASPNVCCNRVDAREYTGKLGLPLPSTDVAILDERGAELATGAVGEIAVRGPQVMRGYWNAPEETARAFTAEGWLRTGDLGRMDAGGYVEFVDRRKDVIVVSGFKAYPTEIEGVVKQHPGVSDAAAVGMPDAHSGEAVALFVVKRDPSLTARALEAHCALHLAPYKRPRLIEFRDRLPKSPIGKTLHRELRATLPTAPELPGRPGSGRAIRTSRSPLP